MLPFNKLQTAPDYQSGADHRFDGFLTDLRIPIYFFAHLPALHKVA